MSAPSASDATRYDVLWRGQFDPSALVVRDDPASRASLTAADRAAIDSLVVERRARGQRIHTLPDGSLPPLYRLSAWSAGPDSLTLTLGRTDYGELLHTNATQPERRAALGDASMSDALAVCAVLVTSDARVLFGERPAAGSPEAPTAAVHVLPSGHPEPPADPTAGLLAELEEETGVLPGELDSIRLTGLVRARPSGKPELTYRLHTRLALDEVLARRPRDVWEFQRLDSFPWTAAGAAAWCRDHARSAAPPGLAAVALAAARY